LPDGGRVAGTTGGSDHAAPNRTRLADTRRIVSDRSDRVAGGWPAEVVELADGDTLDLHVGPVEREEVRVEREPITDANLDAATSGPEISEEEHQVILHEEEPVVEKRTVPKERVQLGKETVTEQEQVGGEVRQEHIEVEGEDQVRRRGRR
jgi:uncharacterized protein (TIGR02271 family)